MDGGELVQAPHAGQTPLSTLVVRGIQNRLHPPSLTAANTNTGTNFDPNESFTNIANAGELDLTFPYSQDT